MFHAKLAVVLLSLVLISCQKANTENPAPKTGDVLSKKEYLEGMGRFAGAGASQLSKSVTAAHGIIEAEDNILSLLFRTIDGRRNNLRNANWGSVGASLLRLAENDYADSVSEPAGQTRMSARVISNGIVAQSESTLNSKGVSDYVWQWGQFLDHDVDLTEPAKPEVSFNIAIPFGDAFFDPFNTGTQEIPLFRSIFTEESGVRQQINEITAFVDASNVYGSDADRARALRNRDGSGMLKVSSANLLPFNTEGLPNAGGTSEELFLAGDPRANEQAGLSAMHTLFVREHNTIAKRMRGIFPRLSGDAIFELTRMIVGAEMQHITYNEFLPQVLGANALPTYRGYRRNVNPGIANEFSAAAYRFGHSMLSPTLLRLDQNNEETVDGNLPLKDAFFNPAILTDEGGIEPLLRGLGKQRAQEVDNMIVDGVRNFLFGPPGSGGFDLAALNIQRGRDHGLPDYNTVREQVGLSRVTSFSEISSDTAVVSKLASLYSSVDEIDLWVGGLAEDHVAGALVGPTFWRIIRNQFSRLRDGDRFWYERQLLSPALLGWVKRQNLASIIRRNTSINEELQDDVFVAPEPHVEEPPAPQCFRVGPFEVCL